MRERERPTIVEKRAAAQLKMTPLELQVIMDVYLDHAMEFLLEKAARGPSLYDKLVAEGKAPPQHRTEPPCMSCGGSKFEAPPAGCLDKKNHY